MENSQNRLLDKTRHILEAIGEFAGNLAGWLGLFLVLVTVLIIFIKKTESILTFFIRFGLLAVLLISASALLFAFFKSGEARRDGFRRAFRIIGICFLITFVLLMLFIFPQIYRFMQSWLSIVQDLQIYIFGIMFMLGISYALKHDEHVRIDIFFKALTPKQQTIINIAGTLLFLLPTCFFITYGSLDLVIEGWNVKKYRITGGLPIQYILESFVVIMPILLSLQAIAQLIKYSSDLSRQGNR